MTQTEQYSIGGYAFTLEKDAAEALGRYIRELENHYLPQEGGREIMDGIEERIAELLGERCRGRVVAAADIQGVIEIIGRPERIEAEDPQADREAPKGKKKLFRDLDNKRLGGVCSGLASFFGIDVTWLRLGFAVLALVTFFSGVQHGAWSLSIPVLYCILWVAMPAARTAQDRWAMKGDSGTADEIKRNVQAGIHEMGDAAREVAHSDFFKQFGRIFLVAVGIILLIGGTSGLASMSLLTFHGPQLFHIPWNELLQEISEEAPFVTDLLSQTWGVVLVALAVILPFVGLL
ncbi:MAG: PspC domain-containing protein, partial [Bacteroidales bacterium]|nr:PspC domain-containing protein [Bacteroidales bacterium]